MADLKKAYDAISKDFSSTRHYAWGEFKEFKKHLKAAMKVLDIGCGNGRLFDYLKDFEISYYEGLDLSTGLLEEARKKHPKVLFYESSMDDLSVLGDKKYDAVFFVASFHHLTSKQSRKKCLLELKKYLNKDALVFMTNWNLFQKKYRKYVWKSFFKSFVSSYAWNDTFIPFTGRGEKVWRYYHAFIPSEIRGIFRDTGYEVVDEFFYKKDRRVDDWKECRNICHVLKASK